MTFIKTLLNLSNRLYFIGVFIFISALLAFGSYLQLVEGIEPCPLCIMQRYAFVVAALFALFGAIHNPKGWMLRLWSLLMTLGALIGSGVAIRQIWLQHNPPTVSTCGPSLNYMLDRFPLAEVLPKLFHGDGDCSEVTWTFLQLSIAEWALISFAAIIAVGLWTAFRRSR